MEAVWWRIERWLNDQAPYVLASLQAGATIADIAETEALLGVRLPEDVRVSYQLHNGQVTNGIGFIEERELLSLQGIRQEWQVWKDLLDGGEFGDWQVPDKLDTMSLRKCSRIRAGRYGQTHSEGIEGRNHHQNQS